MLKDLFLKLIYSTKVRLFFLATCFVGLVIARQMTGMFGISLGYLYVALISLSGFWFGIKGGLLAATVACSLFLIEVHVFKDWVGRDIIMAGMTLRFAVYFLSGVLLGYLSKIEEDKNRKLRQLNKSMNRFIGIVSHDLRSPVVTIQTTASLLLEQLNEKITKEELRFLRIISRSNDFILRLINDFLDISKIESGELELNVTRNDYVGFVEDTVEFNRMIAKRKNITISVIADANQIPRIDFDKERMQQVFNNLVGNAIKYSSPDTTVTVKISQEGDFVATKVIDQGPGIPEPELPKVFKEFYKTTIQHADEEQSTGLGLAIVKRVIEKHNGTVCVESEVGKGSAFCFTLPVQFDHKSAVNISKSIKFS
ncbi:MAG: HAMP domain-containing sensor histidine kinase [Candidatus Omnitrophota bacterium]|nr:HAMP domain-containing sensor histidine kinase [Candidatus Omnitrophota bacterium]